MTFFPAPEAANAARSSMLITGSTRTGSTMIGQLFHSLARVEYSFEPPHLYALFPLIDKMPAEQWKFLYDSYIFEDLIVGAVTGRQLNFNRHDDSSIWRVKSEQEIEARINTAFRREDILKQSEGIQFAYKTVDITPYLSRFRDYYPDAPIIVMMRKPESVLISVMQKGWNSDAALHAPTRIFPLKRSGFPNIPYWVPDGDEERYVAMPPIERCVFYYILMFEGIEKGKDYILVDYDSFVLDPAAKFRSLTDRLGLEFGSTTERLLENVKEPQKDRTVDLSLVDPELLKRMTLTAEACRSHSFV